MRVDSVRPCQCRLPLPRPGKLDVRRRLDHEMLRRGLAGSRHVAQQLISRGDVLVQGSVAAKAGRLVDPAESIEVVTRPQFVGRGGVKLAAAIEAFALDLTGARVIDVGSSTGGFTDCALQHGASEVVTVDVGRGQLHDRLRHDPRVHVHEGTNVRGIDVGTLGGPADMVCADLSFISIRLVLADLARITRRGGRLVLLVKPQFEAGRAEATRGRGVIRDVAVRHRVLRGVVEACAARGLKPLAAISSPITGADGNVEYLLLVERPLVEPTGPGSTPIDLAAFTASLGDAHDTASLGDAHETSGGR